MAVFILLPIRKHFTWYPSFICNTVLSTAILHWSSFSHHVIIHLQLLSVCSSHLLHLSSTLTTYPTTNHLSLSLPLSHLSAFPCPILLLFPSIVSHSFSSFFTTKSCISLVTFQPYWISTVATYSSLLFPSVFVLCYIHLITYSPSLTLFTFILKYIKNINRKEKTIPFFDHSISIPYRFIKRLNVFHSNNFQQNAKT